MPDVEESFSVPKVMADICPIPLTMVPELDNSLSGATMGHFVIAESGGDTTDANLDSSQVETSVLPSTRKRKLDLDEIMEIPEVKMMRLENEQLRNRISLLEKKLKAANRAKQYHEKKWLKLTNFFNDLNKLVPQKDLNEIMDQFQDLPFLCINEDPPKEYNEEIKAFSSCMYFYSPKAYSWLRKKVRLPAPGSIRRWASNIKALPGFQPECWEILDQKIKEDQEKYQYCSLMIDGMSL